MLLGQPRAVTLHDERGAVSVGNGEVGHSAPNTHRITPATTAAAKATSIAFPCAAAEPGGSLVSQRFTPGPPITDSPPWWSCSADAASAIHLARCTVSLSARP